MHWHPPVIDCNGRLSTWVAAGLVYYTDAWMVALLSELYNRRSDLTVSLGVVTKGPGCSLREARETSSCRKLRTPTVTRASKVFIDTTETFTTRCLKSEKSTYTLMSNSPLVVSKFTPFTTHQNEVKSSGNFIRTPPVLFGVTNSGPTVIGANNK